MSVSELIHEIEQLSETQKWQIVRALLESLEQERTNAAADTGWLAFLQQTYGALRDAPLERWEQGDYEEREPLG
jgi:hypothetical protein